MEVDVSTDVVCEHQNGGVEDTTAGQGWLTSRSSPISLDDGWPTTYEIVELVPDERFVMRTAEGPFPMETTYTWETTADGGTRMTLRNRGTPTGFSKLVAPFMARAVRSANRKDLAALKKLLEAVARSTLLRRKRPRGRTLM